MGLHDPRTDALRVRILKAARDLLCEIKTVSGFSIDATAAKAGAARGIVYQQFGSVGGLLEAVYDRLIEEGGLNDLVRASRLEHPIESLDALIEVYARFWHSDRIAFRRLRAAAAFELELSRSLRVRDEHRREGLQVLVKQLTRRGLRFSHEPLDFLYALTSFELLDQLAGSERSIADAIEPAQALARAALSSHARGARPASS